MELFEMERNEGVPKSWQTLEIRFQPGLDSTPQEHPIPTHFHVIRPQLHTATFIRNSILHLPRIRQSAKIK